MKMPGLRRAKCFVGLLGFEPRRTESKSGVLPLHYNPIISISLLVLTWIWAAKIRFKAFSSKRFLDILPN